MNNNEELVSLVRAAVESALTAREGEDRAASIEASLEQANTMVTDLNDSMEAKAADLATKETENTELQAQLQELVARVEELGEKLAKSEEDKAEIETRATAAELHLSDIAKENKLKQRLCQLEEAKVAKSGEKLDSQLAQVKELSDEEFASYLEDRVELRASIEEAMISAAEVAPKADEVTVAPADVQAAKASADAVVPVIEKATEETIEDLYARLGDAMAASVPAPRK
jgi:chromosome segregation ATPase